MRLIAGFTILGLLSLCFQSCDPGLSFEIVNKSGDTATAEIVHYSRGRFFHSEKTNELDTLYIGLSPVSGDDGYKKAFSLGTWTMGDNFDDLAKSIKLIELHSRSETIIYSDSFQIRNLLWKNIQGSSKGRIIIAIK